MDTPTTCASPQLSLSSWPPPASPPPQIRRGLVSGGRLDIWFPQWLKDFCDKNNLLLFSPDYRLLYPSNGQDIIDDVKSLFKFLKKSQFNKDILPYNIQLQPSQIAVAGFSGGGYPARVAGLNEDVKAVLSVYGMGGDFLLDHWLIPGQPHPTIDFIFPNDKAKEAALLSKVPAPIADSPVSVVPPSQFVDPLGRMGLFTAWVNNGTILDVLTSTPGLSSCLRSLPASQRFTAIPKKLQPLFLEYQLTKKFPPTVFVHGSADDVVLPAESKRTYEDLRAVGVRTQYLELVGAGHGLVNGFGMPYPGSDEILVKGAEFLLEELRK
ncbi:hypothetical protein HK097_002525 [Rhizophlyctis rosea]|uniref:Uncharacterized protein n=1 Tax=Rhizophlyctis rosea TaxID=64517 RepID=A0AAD5SGF1_9FUNG|nr:hypothetical protein HK097_002525 [Rhizophlyctis rosea]